MLEQNFDVGTLDVTIPSDVVRCYRYSWVVKWLTKPGKQPLLRVNGSKLFGNKIGLINNEQEGGLFYNKIPGEFLRMPAKEPQVG